MLIDRSQRWWFIGTTCLAGGAVALYLFLDNRAPEGLSGGDLWGMVFGLAGSALMLFAGSLSFLRRVPSWRWLGSRKHWLRGHIWLSLLAGVLIFCHSSWRFGGPLECVLMVVMLLTLFTGVVGLLLQNLIPRLLTQRVPNEAMYDQILHLCDHMRQDSDDLLALVAAGNLLDEQALNELQSFYRELVRPFLGADYNRRSTFADPFESNLAFARLLGRPALALLEKSLFRKDKDGKWAALKGEPGPSDAPPWNPIGWLRTCCDQRRQMGEQERLHFWLHSWLLLHVPLSVMLLVLGLAHVATALYY